MIQKLLSAIKIDETIIISATRHVDNTITMMISVRRKGTTLSPVTATGTEEEITESFDVIVDRVVSPLQKSGLIIQSESFEKDIEEQDAKPATKAPTPAAPKKEKPKTKAQLLEDEIKEYINLCTEEGEKEMEEENYTHITSNLCLKALKAAPKEKVAIEAIRQDWLKKLATFRMNQEEEIPDTPVVDPEATQHESPMATIREIAEASPNVIIAKMPSNDNADQEAEEAEAMMQNDLEENEDLTDLFK